MRKLLLPFAALVLAAAPAAASPKLETVLGKYFDAQGGLDRLRAARSMTYTATDTWDGKSSKITATRARPNLMRFESTGPEGASIKAFDGQKGWFSKAGKAELIPAAKLAGMKARSEFDDPIIDAEKRGHRVSLVGVEDGAYVIELTLASGDTQKRYLDQSTFLEVKRVATFTYDGASHTKTVSFSDFRKTDGIVAAHVMDIEHDGKRGRMVIDQIRWDAKVDLASFAAPKNAAVAAAK